MYQDCLCINEFNYYGNPTIWQDQSSHPMWNSSKLSQPFPMDQSRFLFSPSFDPRLSHHNDMVPASNVHEETGALNDQESSNFGSAMTFCNSSSTSSLVSSPSLTQHNSSSCLMPQSMPSYPSSEQSYHPHHHHHQQQQQTSSMMIPSNKDVQYASCMPNNMDLFTYTPTGHQEKPVKYTKTKIYDCNLCPRSFARKHDLQRHIRVHTGAKPYYCLNCEKAFARTDALKRHLRMEESCRMSPVIQALKNVGMRRYRNL
ncbi:unnamed protein product [Rhizopus stolonifer]